MLDNHDSLTLLLPPAESTCLQNHHLDPGIFPTFSYTAIFQYSFMSHSSQTYGIAESFKMTKSNSFLIRG